MVPRELFEWYELVLRRVEHFNRVDGMNLPDGAALWCPALVTVAGRMARVEEELPGHTHARALERQRAAPELILTRLLPRPVEEVFRIGVEPVISRVAVVRVDLRSHRPAFSGFACCRGQRDM